MPHNPIPPGHRAVITLVPLDTHDRPKALGHPLSATNDQPQVPVVDETNPTSLVVRVDPPADITLDSTITMADSVDGIPTATVTIDWDDSSTVDEANRFNVSIGSEPIA